MFKYLYQFGKWRNGVILLSNPTPDRVEWQRSKSCCFVPLGDLAPKGYSPPPPLPPPPPPHTHSPHMYCTILLKNSSHSHLSYSGCISWRNSTDDAISLQMFSDGDEVPERVVLGTVAHGLEGFRQTGTHIVARDIYLENNRDIGSQRSSDLPH